MRVGIRSTTQLRAKDIRERINKWDFTEIKSFCMAKENISEMKREIKEKINKYYYIKLKSSCVAKEIIIKMKREPTVWENICQ